MIPERYAPHAYALMRIVFGLMFLTYGLQKWNMLGGFAAPIFSTFGIAGLIEIIAGVLIALGLFTRPAAFVASGEMAVAYLGAHQLGLIPVPGVTAGGFPVQNGGIPAVLFCFGFLYMASRGSGIMSIDAGRGGK
jgi:putative oxidoreductase